MAVWQGQKQGSPAQCTPLAVLASAVTSVADAALWLGTCHWPHGLKHATWDHVHDLCHYMCIICATIIAFAAVHRPALLFSS
jgi:hypothetical protein